MTEPGPIDLQPTLEGQTLSLRPLLPGDFEQLHAAASDPLIWEQHPEPTRWQLAPFRRFFDAGLASHGALSVIENASGRIVGTSRYYDWDPDKREIAIGYTFLERRLWGTGANREMKLLMLEHIFPYANKVWLHIGKDNWRSRKAVEKIGGQLAEYAVRDSGGVPGDYAYYCIRKPGTT